MSKEKGKRRAEETVDEIRDKDKDGKKESEISMLDFEDNFEDEFAEEEIVGDDEDGNEGGGSKKKGSDKQPQQTPKAWRPGVDSLEEDEVLEYDPSAYHMMHAMSVTYPCLSFSFIRDELGDNRTKYPHTMYVVTGSQAQEASENIIMVMKLSEIHKLPAEDSDDEDEDEDDEDDECEDDPIVEMKTITHSGAINRIRTVQFGDKLHAATWSDEGVVKIYDLTKHLEALDVPGTSTDPNLKPEFTNRSHTTEGFAMDWSPHNTLRLLSGDNAKAIYDTTFTNGSWKTAALPYLGHTASVEDLQWSPTEAEVFASCSADKTVKIWDARVNQRKAVLSVEAHTSDVNAIAWNKKVAYLLASGSDDNSLKIWDLRNFKAGQSVGHFEYHNDQICSLEWNPFDDTQILVASADNQVTIWDLSLEADEGEDEEEIPPQLFFVHQGQNQVREAHYHPQIPNTIISTAGDGVNIFKPSNT